MPRQAGSRRGEQARTLAAVSAGGMLGALLRYALTAAFAPPTGSFPWATFAVNVTGCLLIGVLLTVLPRVGGARPLLRPFLGTGVLGGYTTFSAYALEAHGAFAAGAPAVALGYLAGTLLCALLAVVTGVAVAGWATGWAVRRTGGPA